MQSDSGLLGWLKVPSVYNIFSAAVGGNALRRSLIQNHVRAKPGDKVIDIGCGSAQVLRYLPDVDYIGIDINPDYIAFARRTYGNKGTFLVGDTQSFRGDPRFKDADIVMAFGLLHHLDDEEARTVFSSPMTPCVRKGDSSVMRRVGFRTRERFPSTSCQLTGAAAFERRNSTASLQGRFLTKWMHG